MTYYGNGLVEYWNKKYCAFVMKLFAFAYQMSLSCHRFKSMSNWKCPESHYYYSLGKGNSYSFTYATMLMWLTSDES